MLLVTVKLESRHWIAIESKFRERLWSWSQSRPKIKRTSMLVEVKESLVSICVPNESVIWNCSWKTEYVLRGIPSAYVADLAGKKGQRRRWFAMSFRIRLRSLSVSTRTCTSCDTRNTTSDCRQAESLSFVWQWPEPDSSTVAICYLAVLGLASLRCLESRDFFQHCAPL